MTDTRPFSLTITRLVAFTLVASFVLVIGAVRPTVVHAAAPTSFTATFSDSDSNGTIDRMIVVVNNGALDACVVNSTEIGTDWTYNGQAGYGGTLASATCDLPSATITFVITGASVLTGGNPVPTLAYDNDDADGSISNVDGDLGTVGAVTTVDGAKPVIISAVTGDNDSNGTVDRLVLTFSESVDVTDGGTDNDITLVASSGTATITAAVYSATNTTTLTYTITTSVSSNTALTITPTYATAGAGSIVDRSPGANEMLNGETVVGTDGAKPAVLTATFYDATSNDGKLDKVIVIWSENISAVANGAADWAISSAANFSTIVEGTVFCNSGAAAANACNYNFTTATAKTSVGDLSLAYTAGTSVTDGTNVASSKTITSASTPAFTDAAAPVVVSSTPASNAAGVLRTSTISLVFSEIVASLTHSISGATLTNGSLSTETVALTGTKIAGSNTFTILTAPDAAANAFNRFVETGTTALAFTVASASSTSSTTSTALTYGIVVSAPEATAAYEAGDEIVIVWSTASGTGTPGAVNLDYSTDGGITYTAIVSGTTNDGSYSWTAPDIDAASVTIRAQGTDLITVLATDTSDAFSIGHTDVDEDASEDTEDDSSDDAAEDTDTSADSTTLLPTGTFMKGESWTTVYYVEGTTRRPFLDAQTFFTYADNFDSVIDTSDDYLANYTIGAPMLPEAGSVLIKIVSVNNVYALGEDGELRWISSESVASDIYGSNWADYVIDVPVTAWSQFTFGADIDSSSDISLDGTEMQTRDALNSK